MKFLNAIISIIYSLSYTFTPSISVEIGGNCTTSLECQADIAGPSICIKELGVAKCLCDRGYYGVPSETECHKIIGKSCSNNAECQYNPQEIKAVCLPPTGGGTCQCPPDQFVHPILNICLPKSKFINDACALSSDCDEIPNSICDTTLNICVCDPDTHFLNSKLKNCSVLPSQLHHPCEFDENCEGSSVQVQNMACIEKNDSTTGWGECNCKTGYVENQSTCKLGCSNHTTCGVNEYCENLEYCDPKKNMLTECEETVECNQLNSECKDDDGSGKKCLCRDNYIPDPFPPISNSMCSLNRTQCATPDVCQLEEYCDSDSLCQSKKTLGSNCAANEECKPENSKCDSVCACDTAYKPTPEGLCILKLCTVEDDNVICNVATQYCDQQDGICKIRKNLGEPCADNVECLPENSACISGTCRCTVDFKPSPESPNDTCVREVCPGDFQCNLFEYCKNGVCKDKEPLGNICVNDEDCKGTFSRCHSFDDSTKFCDCQDNYKPNPDPNPGENNCVLKTCPGDLTCTDREYCDPNSNGGSCKTLKVIESLCSESYECFGFETNNIACVDRLANGIKSCYCAIGLIPDRPVKDPNMVCIDFIENIECYGVDVYGTEWVAFPGETQTMPCPGRPNGAAVWKCLANGNFQGSQPSFENCTTEWVNELSNKLSNITAEDGTIDIDEAKNFMLDMESLLDDAFIADGGENADDDEETQFFGHEIKNMLTIVDTIVNGMDVTSVTRNLNDTTALYEEASGEAFSISNKLMRFNKPWEQLPLTNRTSIFTDVLNVIDTTAFQLANKVNDSGSDMEENNYSKTYKENSFDVTSGISDSDRLNYPLESKMRTGKDSFIKLPSNWQDAGQERYRSNKYAGKRVNLQQARKNLPGQILNTEELTLESSKLLNGDLLGFSLSQNPQEATKLIDGKAEVTFYHGSDSWGDQPKKVPRNLFPGEQPKAARGTTACAIFNEQKKVWTNEGCNMKLTGPYATVCECDQLGKYGLMSEFHEYPGKTTILETITIIGFGASTLLQAFRVYKSTQTSNNDDVQSQMKKFMMMFLMSSNILLVAFVDRNYFYISDSWCYFIGLLSHFVGLCALMCIALAGINIYMFPNLKPCQEVNNQDQDEENPKGNSPTAGISGRLIGLKTFIMAHKKSFYISLIVGIPVFISVVTMIIGAIAGSNSRVYGGDFCWLDGWYIWAFFAPAILAVFISVLLLFLLGRYIDRELQKLPVNDQSEEEQEYSVSLSKYRIAMQHNVAFSLLVGITWTVGYYQLGPHYSDSQFAQFSFPALTFLQGLLISWQELEVSPSEYIMEKLGFSIPELNNDENNNEIEKGYYDKTRRGIENARNNSRAGVKNMMRPSTSKIRSSLMQHLPSELQNVPLSKNSLRQFALEKSSDILEDEEYAENETIDEVESENDNYMDENIHNGNKNPSNVVERNRNVRQPSTINRSTRNPRKEENPNNSFRNLNATSHNVSKRNKPEAKDLASGLFEDLSYSEPSTTEVIERARKKADDAGNNLLRKMSIPVLELLQKAEDTTNTNPVFRKMSGPSQSSFDSGRNRTVDQLRRSPSTVKAPSSIEETDEETVAENYQDSDEGTEEFYSGDDPEPKPRFSRTNSSINRASAGNSRNSSLRFQNISGKSEC